MTARRFAILDPVAGISGDMLLGALIDAGAPVAWLQGVPARLGLEGVTVRVGPVTRASLAAVKVDVVLPDGSLEGPHDHREETPGPQHHAHEPHQHHHPQHDGHGAHRHVADLVKAIERAPLSAWVKERATRAFMMLAAAEAASHGVRPEDVALHEVGALDALVDIVGGIEGFEQLGIDRIYHRPVALGSGWVTAAHGRLPVPAPVTLRLLEGVATAPDGPVRGEATTPTGAVLLRVLSAGAPPSGWRPIGGGLGAGGRDPEDYPNTLRLILCEGTPEDAEVITIASDLDDLSPEYLEPLREALVGAGALDVQVWSTMGKKGRIGFRIEVQAAPAAETAVTEAFFAHSTTLGVRRWVTSRTTLPRREMHVVADGMDVRVKVAEGPGGTKAKAEFDDVRAAAAQVGRPAHLVAREAQARAAEALARPAAPGAVNPNQEQA
jgi:uncharacterized protein (TIGR00299 family) protein